MQEGLHAHTLASGTGAMPLRRGGRNRPQRNVCVASCPPWQATRVWLWCARGWVRALTRDVVADVQAFNQQLELAFVEENWGTTYEQVFTDIQNACVGKSNSRVCSRASHIACCRGDMWSWLEIALRTAVYDNLDNPPVYRDGATKKNSYAYGGVQGFNFFLGRPRYVCTCARVHWCNRASLGRRSYCCVARRIRTIRSSPCSYDTVELSSMLEFSPLHNATCFKYDCPDRCAVPTPSSRSHGYVTQNSFYDDSEKTSGESFSTGTIEYVLCGTHQCECH